MKTKKLENFLNMSNKNLDAFVEIDNFFIFSLKENKYIIQLINQKWVIIQNFQPSKKKSQ